jgi:hypothetical protein
MYPLAGPLCLIALLASCQGKRFDVSSWQYQEMYRVPLEQAAIELIADAGEGGVLVLREQSGDWSQRDDGREPYALAVLRGKKLRKVCRVDLAQPYCMVSDPESKLVWFGERAGRVTWMDLTTGKVRRMRTGTTNVHADVWFLGVADKGRVVAADNRNGIWIFEPEAEVGQRLAVGDLGGSYPSMLRGSPLLVLPTTGAILRRSELEHLGPSIYDVTNHTRVDLPVHHEGMSMIYGGITRSGRYFFEAIDHDGLRVVDLETRRNRRIEIDVTCEGIVALEGHAIAIVRGKVLEIWDASTCQRLGTFDTTLLDYDVYAFGPEKMIFYSPTIGIVASDSQKIVRIGP